MLFYELYQDGPYEPVEPPINSKLPRDFPCINLGWNYVETVKLLGLDGEAPMSWRDLCAIMLLSPAAYRPVRQYIADGTGQLPPFIINRVAKVNYYKYKAIRDSFVEYNPIENYNMVEESTADRTENPFDVTNEYGAQSRTLSRDPYTDTTNIGASKETTTLGSGVDTSETPQIKTETARGKASTKVVDAPNTSTTTSTHSVQGFDSTTFRNDTQDTAQNVNPERTQTTTADAVTDTETTAPVTVKSTIGQRENTVDTAAREDSVNYGEFIQTDSAGEHTDTVSTGEKKSTEKGTLKRSGNIGVTTTQQMLEQELLLRQKTEYLNIVARDIINALTIGVYSLGGVTYYADSGLD